jgi:hypothetical protein
VLVPVSFVLYLDGRGPAYDLPLSVLLICGLLGGVIGTVAASVGEFDTARDLGGVPTLLVGLIEEGAKLLVPVGVLLFTRFRSNPADGLLVGVAVGTGFAVLETLGYGFVTLLRSGDLGVTEVTVLARGVLSPAAHIAWTGLAAAALWHAHAPAVATWRGDGCAGHLCAGRGLARHLGHLPGLAHAADRRRDQPGAADTADPPRRAPRGAVEHLIDDHRRRARSIRIGPAAG